MSILLACLASSMGVNPSAATALISAPCAKSKSTASSLAAKCSGVFPVFSLELGFALFARRTWITPMRFAETAECKGVKPWASHVPILAPFAMRMSATSLVVAAWSGVAPVPLVTLTAAPLVTRAFTEPACPPAAASCKGVESCLSFTLISAPPCTRTSTISPCPYIAARYSAV